MLPEVLLWHPLATLGLPNNFLYCTGKALFNPRHTHAQTQTRDALATATLADLNSYTKRFGRLAGPGSGEIDLAALLHHFDSELLTGTALQRILEHVGVAGAVQVTRGQFLAVAHLACTVLQQVQQALFEGEASDGSLASPPPASAKHASPAASQHSCVARRRTASGAGGSWSIRAERGPARGARRPHHPTVAELLSQAGMAEGSQAPSRSAVSARGGAGMSCAASLGLHGLCSRLEAVDSQRKDCRSHPRVAAFPGSAVGASIDHNKWPADSTPTPLRGSAHQAVSPLSTPTLHTER